MPTLQDEHSDYERLVDTNDRTSLRSSIIEFIEIFKNTSFAMINNHIPVGVIATTIMMTRVDEKDMAEAVPIVSTMMMLLIYTSHVAFFPFSFKLRKHFFALVGEKGDLSHGMTRSERAEDRSEWSYSPELFPNVDRPISKEDRDRLYEKINRTPRQAVFANLLYFFAATAMMLSTRPILSAVNQKESVVRISEEIFNGFAPCFFGAFLPATLGTMILRAHGQPKIAMGISLLSLMVGIGVQYEFVFNKPLSANELGFGSGIGMMVASISFSSYIACRFKMSHFLKSSFTRFTREDCKEIATFFKNTAPLVFTVSSDLLALVIINLMANRNDETLDHQVLAVQYINMNRLLYMAGSQTTALMLEKVRRGGFTINIEDKHQTINHLIKSGILVSIVLQSLFLGVLLAIPNQFNQFIGSSISETMTREILLANAPYMLIDSVRLNLMASLHAIQEKTIPHASLIAAILLWPGIGISYGLSQISALEERGYPLGLALGALAGIFRLKEGIKTALETDLGLDDSEAETEDYESDEEYDSSERVRFCPRLSFFSSATVNSSDERRILCAIR